MDRKLKRINLILWIIIALSLTIFLIYSIVNLDKDGWGMFQINFGNKEEIVQKDEKISIDECNDINLECLNNDIKVLLTDENDIRIIQKSTEKLKEEEKVSLLKKDTSILIKQNEVKTRNFIFNFSGLSNEIEIYIPKKYNKNLNIKSTSGDIEIEDNINLDKIKVQQTSGDFECEDSIKVNEISLESTSGNIEINTIDTNSYNIHALSGDIKIDKLLGSGEINTTSGNIKINYTDIKEKLEANAKSGDIKINIPKNLSFEFYGKVSSGDIDTNFDVNYKNKDCNEATAKIGNGPYKKINIETSSGNIDINQK